MAKKPNKRNALGRGLGALLSDSDDGAVLPESKNPASNIAEIPVTAIETNPYQPRTHFDLVALEELADSIRVHGIIQPITVRKLGDSYQLISGERRFQASKTVGLKTVPAYIRTANDEQMLEMALIENIQRQDLNPIEVALGYQRLIDELGLRQEDLGEKVGKKRATVNNYLRLLKLPPGIQFGLKERRISMGHARALVTVEDKDRQIDIYNRIIEESLSVRKVEEIVRGINERKQTPGEKKETPKRNIHIVRLERELEEKIGNKVQIKQATNGKGEMRLHFENTEDLNRILDILQLT